MEFIRAEFFIDSNAHSAPRTAEFARQRIKNCLNRLSGSSVLIALYDENNVLTGHVVEGDLTPNLQKVIEDLKSAENDSKE